MILVSNCIEDSIFTNLMQKVNNKTCTSDHLLVKTILLQKLLYCAQWMEFQCIPTCFQRPPCQQRPLFVVKYTMIVNRFDCIIVDYSSDLLNTLPAAYSGYSSARIQSYLTDLARPKGLYIYHGRYSAAYIYILKSL